MKTTKALLLIAHGSRNPQANEDLVWLAGHLADQGFSLIQPSYLELAQPDILEGGRLCVERGATEVLMVPYFLSAGVHVRQDLTEARETLATQYPEVEFRLTGHLGRHPLLVQLVLTRIAEAQNQS